MSLLDNILIERLSTLSALDFVLGFELNDMLEGYLSATHMTRN